MSVTTPGDQPRSESNLIRALRVLRERWWVVALSVLVCTAIALALSLRAQDEYAASATLLLRNPNLDTALTQNRVFDESSDPARDSFTNINLVTSTRVGEAVRKQLGSDDSAEDLVAKVTVAEEENADVATITARDPSPQMAADIANAFARQFVNVRRQQDRARIREAVDYIDEQVNTLGPEHRGSLLELREARRRLVALEALQTGGAEIADEATVPSTPVSPQPKRDAVLGFLFGLVLGTALAFLLDVLDNRLKRTEDFEDAYDARVLTSIPQRAFDPRNEEDRVAAFERYRILRGALDYRMIQEDLRTLLVTSAGDEEGKTTIAVNVARAFAAAGQRVVLVEGDLRRPSFAQHFQVPPGAPGLAAVLTGQAQLGEVLRQSGTPGLGNLYILPAGALPHNAPELLESRAMHDVLTQLAEFGDVVVIDAPPLLPVADARILLDHPAVDGCLVVARAYRATRPDARRVRTVFEQHGREPIGLVACGTKSDDVPAAYTVSNGAGPRHRVGLPAGLRHAGDERAGARQ